MKKNKNILVLGAKGMLGQTVYKYLKTIYSETYGTDYRNDNNLFFLSAKTLNRDFKKILSKTKEIDFIVNCIGVLPSSGDTKDMIYVNSFFPKRLAYLAQKNNAKVIHVSTDAVFSTNSGYVYENTKPNPDTVYGKTKLKGEANNHNFLNIRTSTIGLDSVGHRGLLEWAKASKKINGFTDHIWTGCTTLQFAKACDYLIEGDNFTKVRVKSSVIHYAPLGPISKFDLLKIYLKEAGINKKINQTLSLTPVDRRLRSIYNVISGSKDIDTTIIALINFYKE